MPRVDPETDLGIRPFQAADRGGVLDLWRSVLPDSAPHNDAEWTLTTKLATDPDLLFVAELRGRVAGTAMGGWDGHRGWIYAVAVDPDLRGRGIGSDLVRAVEAALRRRGCAKVNLQVRASNAGVAEFYERLGFVPENLISMGKRLYDGERLPRDSGAADD